MSNPHPGPKHVGNTLTQQRGAPQCAPPQYQKATHTTHQRCTTHNKRHQQAQQDKGGPLYKSPSKSELTRSNLIYKSPSKSPSKSTIPPLSTDTRKVCNCMHVCMYACMSVCITYVRTHACLCMHVCMYVCGHKSARHTMKLHQFLSNLLE